MNKSKVLLWRYGNKEPDESPMIVSHIDNDLPKFLTLASFEHSNVQYFKLIDIIIGGLRVYYQTYSPPVEWSGQP